MFFELQSLPRLKSPLINIYLLTNFIKNKVRFHNSHLLNLWHFATTHISVLTFTIFTRIWCYSDGEAGGIIWKHYKHTWIWIIIPTFCYQINKCTLSHCVSLNPPDGQAAQVTLGIIKNLYLMLLRLSSGISSYFKDNSAFLCQITFGKFMSQRHGNQYTIQLQ